MNKSIETTIECCVVCGHYTAFRTLAKLPLGQVVRCSMCEVHSITPQPTVEQLAAAYQNFNAGEIARENFNAYVGQAKHILLSDLERAGLRGTKGVRFLDYGCGAGHFVEAAAELGVESWGIDLDATDTVFGQTRGINIRTGDFRSLDTLGPQSYHAILMMHVLEHVPRPREVLAALLEKLQPRGALIVRVPDQDSVPSHMKRLLRSVGIKRGEWGFVQPPIHLHGYCARTFEVLAANLKLEIVRLTKVSPLDQHEFPTTRTYWQNLGIHRKVYWVGRVAGSGGHLVAIFRRPG